MTRMMSNLITLSAHRPTVVLPTLAGSAPAVMPQELLRSVLAAGRTRTFVSLFLQGVCAQTPHWLWSFLAAKGAQVHSGCRQLDGSHVAWALLVLLGHAFNALRYWGVPWEWPDTMC